MAGPLAGLRVMDVSIMAAGPWVGALLGELGAEVIKVEPPDGDGARFGHPLQRGLGAVWICMSVNKRGVVLDLKDPEGCKHALDLAASCDVFIQNFRVGVIERLGLGYEKLRELNPRQVYCSVSGFGEVGPLAREGCADPIMQAFSGYARLSGAPADKLEHFRFTGLIDLTSAIAGTQAVLAALVERETSGRGQKVEVSMLEACLAIQSTRIAEYLATGQCPHPWGNQSPGIVPDRAFATADREVFVTAHDEAQWRGFCKAIQRPELAEDPRFATNRARVERREELSALLEPVFLKRPAIWWMRVFERNGVPCGLAQHFEINRYHAQVRENGMIAELDSPHLGRVMVGGLPWHFSKTPCRVLPPPKPGGDTEEVLAELAQLRDRQEATAPPETDSSAPILSGLRVVEFASGVAGPVAGVRLGDLGASVVKVEPAEGDWMRGCPPFMADGKTGAVFFALNRGKRSVALGATPEAAAPVLRRLLETADVFITDRTPAELAALGLDAVNEEQCGFNPGLITISISGFGDVGPLAGRPGSELVAQAMAGYTRWLGAYGLPPRRLGADQASVATGTFAVHAVLAALVWRKRTGEGQRVTMSLLNSLLSMKSVQITAQTNPDAYVGPRVGGYNDPPEYGYATADFPIHFSLGGSVGKAGRPGWVQWAEELGLQRLIDDPRFDRTGRDSTSHGPRAMELKGEYEREFATIPAQTIVEATRKYGGRAAIYVTHDEVFAHPQVQAMRQVRTVPTGDGSEARVLAFPGRFSRTGPEQRGIAPGLGQHSMEVALELGFPKAEDAPLLHEGGLP